MPDSLLVEAERGACSINGGCVRAAAIHHDDLGAARAQRRKLFQCRGNIRGFVENR